MNKVFIVTRYGQDGSSYVFDVRSDRPSARTVAIRMNENQVGRPDHEKAFFDFEEWTVNTSSTDINGE